MADEHRILLVDDDLADRLLARQAIRRAARTLPQPVSLREVSSGAEALSAVGEFRPTLLLIDLRMPVMDGFELIRRLRTRPEVSGARLVVLSTSSAPSDRSEARRLGCEDYIVKPLRPDDLSDRLAHRPEPPTDAPSAQPGDMQQYRVLLQELSDIAVLVFDHELRYRLVDGPALARHGWSEDQLLGRTLDEVFPPEIAARLRPMYEAALAGRRNTYAFTDTGGHQYEVLTRPVPVEGEPTRGMLLIREVTALRRAEEALDAQRAQLGQLRARMDELGQEAGQWARFASHDLAALLRQLDSAEGLDAAELGAFFSAIRPTAQRARGRLEQMLQYHRASQPLLEWVQLDIPSLFALVRAERSARIAALGATVGCDPMPVILFDPDALHLLLGQVLDHALSRARGGAPLRIWLSSRAVEGGVELLLSDTGAPLGPGERIALFQPRWDLGGGVGVGLATCRRLLDAVGSWIRAADTPGGGLTISFLIPHPPSED